MHRASIDAFFIYQTTLREITMKLNNLLLSLIVFASSSCFAQSGSEIIKTNEV